MAHDNPAPTFDTLLERALQPDMQRLIGQVLESELRGRLPRWFPRWLVPIIVAALLTGGRRSALYGALLEVALQLDTEASPFLRPERRIPEPPASPRPQ